LGCGAHGNEGECVRVTVFGGVDVRLRWPEICLAGAWLLRGVIYAVDMFFDIAFAIELGQKSGIDRLLVRG